MQGISCASKLSRACPFSLDQRYLAAGLPIATGFIEGACRRVVKDHLERSGKCLTREGAQVMLNLRCVDSSELWDAMLAEH
jgi:hypothetical protein